MRGVGIFFIMFSTPIFDGAPRHTDHFKQGHELRMVRFANMKIAKLPVKKLFFKQRGVVCHSDLKFKNKPLLAETLKEVSAMTGLERAEPVK
jgi:hypothetical protein